MVSRKPQNKKLITAIIVVFLLIVTMGIFAGVTIFSGNSADPDDPYPVKGVDLSSYQGEINWSVLSKEDISFAYIRATDGNKGCDENFDKNWKEAGKTDLRTGAYHFLDFNVPGEAQAENYISHVEKKSGMLPPAIEIELYGDYTESGHQPDQEKIDAVLLPLTESLISYYGQKPIIYTNPYVYKTYIAGNYDEFDIWISDPSFPTKLSDGKEWTFCQYSFTEKLKGYSGDQPYIDMDVFNGSRWKFRRYGN